MGIENLFAALCMAAGLAKLISALGISLGWLLVRLNWIIRLIVVPPLLVGALCLINIGWVVFYGPEGRAWDLDILVLSTVYVACVAFVWWVVGLHGIYDRFFVRGRD